MGVTSINLRLAHLHRLPSARDLGAGHELEVLVILLEPGVPMGLGLEQLLHHRLWGVGFWESAFSSSAQFWTRRAAKEPLGLPAILRAGALGEYELDRHPDHLRERIGDDRRDEDHGDGEPLEPGPRHRGPG